MSVQQENFKEIADAIREKTGSEELIKPSEFASKIDDVYEEGTKSGVAKFWNGITDNGARGVYGYAFRYMRFDEELLSEPIIVRPTIATNMFHEAKGEVDLAEIEKNGGVKFDFSKCTGADYLFRDVEFTGVGVIDATSFNNLDRIFYCGAKTNSHIKWVEKLIVKETHTFSNTFRYNEALEHIIFEGTIGNPLNMRDCNKLDKASIESAVNCALNVNTVSLTFSEEAVNKAFETSEGANDGSASAEWATLIGTKPNCTISLA